MYSRGITRTCKMAETGGERTSKKSYRVTQALQVLYYDMQVGLNIPQVQRQTYSYIETKKQNRSHALITPSITTSPAQIGR